MYWLESICFGKGSIFRRFLWLPSLDADKEGFLRSARSLIQTIGRAARNAEGRVILYADKETDSIRQNAWTKPGAGAKSQAQFNIDHGITPTTVKKRISSLQDSIWEQDYVTVPVQTEEGGSVPRSCSAWVD